MKKENAMIKALKYREWADKADQKAEVILKEFESHPGHDDWNYWTQPIHANARGRAFAKQRERLLNRRSTAWELQEKAKRFRDKAANLERFANTNKGDAERRREEERNYNDKMFNVGSRVNTVIFGCGVISKINTKTYRVKLDSGSEFAVDKSFIRAIA